MNKKVEEAKTSLKDATSQAKSFVQEGEHDFKSMLAQISSSLQAGKPNAIRSHIHNKRMSRSF